VLKVKREGENFVVVRYWDVPLEDEVSITEFLSRDNATALVASLELTPTPTENPPMIWLSLGLPADMMYLGLIYGPMIAPWYYENNNILVMQPRRL
jgi:hypothetical protein